MRKEKIELVGKNKQETEMRIFCIEYDAKRSTYSFTLRSSSGKRLGDIKLPRQEVLEPLKWLNIRRDLFFRK